MKVELKVTVGVKEYYNFLMNHAYNSISGFIGVLISIGAYIGLLTTWYSPAFRIQYKLALLVTGLMFTVIQPIMIYFNARKQTKRNNSQEKPFFYSFSSEGIDIKQGEASAYTHWQDVTKVISTKRNIVIYVGRLNAYVIPKHQIGEQFADFRKIIINNCTSAKTVKVKY